MGIVMKKLYAGAYKKRVFCLLAAGIAAGMISTGVTAVSAAEEVYVCGGLSQGNTGMIFGSVPYFIDDAGQNTQMADGYLYGYWNNRLCRYDPVTLEETVLYEAASSQRGDFCIWNEYVYFMVVPNVSSVGKIHGWLYRVKCDGSEEAVCLTSVQMPGQEYSDFFSYYTLDTYGDILYLIREGKDEDNRYFHLNQDGSIGRASRDETLYGQLPQGYAEWAYKGRPFGRSVTLPYAMRNYGYIFAEDENGKLVRIDPDSQAIEDIHLPESCYAYNIVLAHDAVLICDAEYVWYRISLDNLEETEKIGQASERMTPAFLSEDGIYLVSWNSDDWTSLYFLDWSGEEAAYRYSFTRNCNSEVELFDGTYYYYTAPADGDEIVRRLEPAGDEAAEKVAVYYQNPYRSITARERIDYSWTDEYTGAYVEYSITEVYFTEETEAFEKINSFLKNNLYSFWLASVENVKEVLKADFDRDFYEECGPDYQELSDTANVCYIDENYVGIRMDWYNYERGAAHGMYGSDYYMFDRHTGEKIGITDVVNNSPEEVCEIIAPYVEAVAYGGTDKEMWEAMLLEEDRFFLSEEGIGIHFDVYEIDSYAAGDKEIIVPYSAFELKEQRQEQQP